MLEVLEEQGRRELSFEAAGLSLICDKQQSGRFCVMYYLRTYIEITNVMDHILSLLKLLRTPRHLSVPNDPSSLVSVSVFEQSNHA